MKTSYLLVLLAVVIAFFYLLGRGGERNTTSTDQTGHVYPTIAQNENKSMTALDCANMGSNYRAELCLQELEKQKRENSIPFPRLDLLEITDFSSRGNTYYEPNPTISGTIANRSNNHAKDIILKLKLYPLTQKIDCNTSPSDTVYLNVLSYLLSGDGERFNSIVPTSMDTSRGVSICYEVFYASL